MTPLVLASISPYRRALMAQLGLPFSAVAPRYQEEHGLDVPTAELVQHLALRKAQSLRQDHPQAIIVAADQVAEIDGTRLFKPGTVERAVEQLLRLAGRTHRLITGLAVLDAASGRVEQALDVQHMTLRPLSPEQAEAYVAAERPLDCAGAYRIEGRGIALFESIRTEDYTGIIGLPLIQLTTLLGRFGIDPLRPAQ
jgi:septum formation protein